MKRINLIILIALTIGCGRNVPEVDSGSYCGAWNLALSGNPSLTDVDLDTQWKSGPVPSGDTATIEVSTSGKQIECLRIFSAPYSLGDVTVSISDDGVTWVPVTSFDETSVTYDEFGSFRVPIAASGNRIRLEALNNTGTEQEFATAEIIIFGNR